MSVQPTTLPVRRTLLRGFTFALLGAAILLTLVLSLSPGPPVTGRDGATQGMGLTAANYEIAVRSYLTRNAFINSLWSTALSALPAALAGWALRPLLQATQGTRRKWVLWPVVLLPVATPALLLALGGRMLLDPLLTRLHDPAAAVLTVALLQAWRLTPLAAAIFLVRGGGRGRLTALAATAYVAWVDPGVGLLLTQGEPFNASHLAAGWALMQARVNHDLAHGAALSILLMGPALLLAGTALAGLVTGAPPETARAPERSGWARAGMGWLIWLILLLPVAVLLMATGQPRGWPAAWSTRGELAHMLRWGLNSLLVMGVVWLWVAGSAAAQGNSALGDGDRRLTKGDVAALLGAAAALPLLPVAVLWAAALLPWAPALLLFALCGSLLAGAAAPLLPRREAWLPAYLAAAQLTGPPLVLTWSMTGADLPMGVVTFLAGNPALPPLSLVWAILAPGLVGVALLTAGMIGRKRHRL